MTVERVECTSRIEQVVVYARGALVTRRVVLPEEPLPQASCELVVRGVTALAEVGGARAQVDGARAVVALRSRLVLPEPAARPGELLEAVRELDLAARRLADERGAVQSQRDALATVGLDLGLEGRARRVDPSARLADARAVSGLLAAELARLDARLRALDAAAERNAREREAAALRAAQARAGRLGGDALPTYEFLVRLAGDGAGRDAPLRGVALEYAVRAARWWPAYTARFTEGGTRVHWTLEALVAQDSGEDWGEVALALSTADLVQDARLPELPSLRLGRAQPLARKGYRPPPVGLEAMWEGFDHAARAALPPADDTRLPVSRAAPASPPRQAHGAKAELAGSTRAGAVSAPRNAPYGGEAMDLLAVGGGGVDEDLGAVASYDAPAEFQAQEANAVAFAAPLAGPAGDVSPAREELKKRGGFFPGGGGGALPPPPPSAAAPLAPQAMRMRAAAARSSSSTASAEQLQRVIVPAAPAAIEPADAWFEFDALVMADPDDGAHRGRLVREPAAALGAGRTAEQARAAVEQLAAPPLARDPRETRGHFDHRYDARARADVPSDLRLHRVPVASAEATALVAFRAVPRETPEVYREAEITNPLDAPLLGGPVDVFIDGALTTTSAVTAVDRGGTVYLGLGVEDRLRVARNARVDEGTAGLLGGSSVIEHAVTIDLASSLGRAVRVDVIDRVPVTTEKDIDVALTSQQPAASAYEQAERGAPVKGGLRWRVEVPAGGKARVEFGYRITLPAKNELVGGNRRE